MALVDDLSWCEQDKEDGNHVIVGRTPTRLVALNRKGEPHPIPKATADALMDLAENTLIDGEKLHEGGFVIFDAMYINDQDIRELPYRDRYDISLRHTKQQDPPATVEASKSLENRQRS